MANWLNDEIVLYVIDRSCCSENCRENIYSEIYKCTILTSDSVDCWVLRLLIAANNKAANINPNLQNWVCIFCNRWPTEVDFLESPADSAVHNNSYLLLYVVFLPCVSHRWGLLYVKFFKVHLIQIISTEVTEDSQKCTSADCLNPGLLQWL